VFGTELKNCSQQLDGFGHTLDARIDRCQRVLCVREILSFFGHEFEIRRPVLPGASLAANLASALRAKSVIGFENKALIGFVS